MKLKEFKEEIVWLLKALANANNQKEVISFWSVVAELQSPKIEKKIPISSRRVVTVIGEPTVVYTMTNLFDQLPADDTALLLTSDIDERHPHAKYCAHPFLEWVDVLYVPPACVKEQIARIGTVTLMTDSKLPLWSRTLFNNNLVANIVATKLIKMPPARDYISVYDVSQFSYGILLDDFIPALKPTIIDNRIPAMLPKDFVAKIYLEENQEREKRLALIDEAAITMINTYWLQNNPNVASWLPHLLEELQVLLKIRSGWGDHPEIIIAKMKDWGEALTHVNRA